uniref:Uncharacterized protein n=1 Tax=Anguilla anguilla TaxID=7936 RepID=A0A0E9TQH0_ANGAN
MMLLLVRCWNRHYPSTW